VACSLVIKITPPVLCFDTFLWLSVCAISGKKFGVRRSRGHYYSLSYFAHAGAMDDLASIAFVFI
jgi:hypothetical protein